jgi:hypothetical protein
VTSSELALQLRILLLEAIAPDACCARCRRPTPHEELEVDHVEGRTWCGRRLNFLDRIRRQWHEYVDGVALSALCRSCNASDGQRLRGQRRYVVAYR